ncbi:MAG: leucine-rich repeat domain-containing protein [Bacteroidaceae bacterium]|nr:leucine-rich repeat domain-containing protein [Bacteroidaceae bacterium]
MKHFFTLLSFSLPLLLCAQSFEVNGITFEPRNSYSSEVAVTRGSRAYSGYVNIPSNVSHNGRNYTVSTIADRTFKDSYLSGLSLPYSISTIGNEAFKGCRGLSRINLPSALRSLGTSCFEDCANLYAVEFGYCDLRSLPERCFKGCSSLRTIRWPNYITSIGEACFQDCRSLTDVSIPYRVETLGRNAFRGCRSLNHVKLPQYLRRIESYCFGACYSLRKIVCESRNPYAVYDSSAFYSDGTNLFTQATLHVPRGSIRSYQSLIGWRDFKSIHEQ